MTELPKGWARARLDDVAAVSGGIQKQPSRAPRHHTAPFLRVANVGSGTLNLDDVHEIEITPDELERFALQPGDLLVVEGNGSASQIGRAARWQGEIAHCVHQNHLMRVRPSQAISSQFLEYLWMSPAVREEVRARAASTSGLFVLTTKKISAVEVPVAPLAEQERVVIAIEEAFSKLEAGEAGLRDVRQLLKRTREAILAAAVTGRLVPQNSTDTPVAKLLADLGAEAVQPLEGESPLPQTWMAATLVDLSELVTDGDHRPPKRVPSGIPHLTAKNVRGGRFDLTGCSFVTEAGFAQTRSRYEPLAGDVIVTCVGTIGRVAVVPPGLAFSADRNLAAIRPKAGIEAEYVRIVMESPWVQRRIDGASGSTAQPHLYLRDLRAIVLPVPPAEEQVRIVAEVERQMSFIEACERSVDAGLEVSAALRRSVLKAAFEGRLVPQDPTDEQAAVVLERIRAERAATPKPKKRRAKATA